MERYFFMGSILRMISEAAFFRRVFVIALRVLSAAVGLAGLTGFVYNWNFIAKLPAAKILGGIIFQLLFVVAIYMVIHTILIRAKDVAELQETELRAIPIAPIGFRLIGEIYCLYVIPIAVGGGIFIWFAGPNALNVLRKVAILIPNFSDTSFTGGILYILVNSFSAFFTFVFFYFISEMVSVMFNMTKDIKELKQR